MENQSCRVIEAILHHMGFLTFRQSTYEIDNPKYNPEDNHVVIYGLLNKMDRNITKPLIEEFKTAIHTRDDET